jgi:hypothetical protein
MREITVYRRYGKAVETCDYGHDHTVDRYESATLTKTRAVAQVKGSNTTDDRSLWRDENGALYAEIPQSGRIIYASADRHFVSVPQGYPCRIDEVLRHE